MRSPFLASSFVSGVQAWIIQSRGPVRDRTGNQNRLKHPEADCNWSGFGFVALNARPPAFNRRGRLAHPMSKIKHALDLTKQAPRSCYVRLGGYVLLPRLLDKIRAGLAGTLGAYDDGATGMNGRFLRFVGISHAALKRQVAKGGGDAEILAWIEAHAKHQRDPWEIAAWSDYQSRRPVDSDAETLENFAKAMRRLHADREDIKTRFDFLDLDDYCSFGGKA